MGTPTSTGEERLVRDLFPCEVYVVGGKVIRLARVFVTTERVIVWEDSKHHGLRIAEDFRLAEPWAVEPSRAMLTTKDRLEIAGLVRGLIVNKAHGCGCTSALKGIPRPAEWAV